MNKTLMTLCVLSLVLTLGSCRSKNDMSSATSDPMPTMQATTSPNVTTVLPQATGIIDGMMDGMDGANDGTGTLPDSTVIPESTGVTSMDKARRVIEDIEDELERLSEVEDAEVVIAGRKAAVGIEFDDQYQAGLDDRLRKIIKERIDSVISGITTVAITADADIRNAIEALGDRLDTMSDMAALESDLDAIIRKINGVNA